MLAILLTLSRLTLHLPTVGQVIECVNRRCQPHATDGGKYGGGRAGYFEGDEHKIL